MTWTLQAAWPPVAALRTSPGLCCRGEGHELPSRSSAWLRCDAAGLARVTDAASAALHTRNGGAAPPAQVWASCRGAPLVVLPSAAAGGALVPPALPHGEPLQRQRRPAALRSTTLCKDPRGFKAYLRAARSAGVGFIRTPLEPSLPVMSSTVLRIRPACTAWTRSGVFRPAGPDDHPGIPPESAERTRMINSVQ